METAWFDRPLWRLRDVRDYLGVDEKTVRLMVECGSLKRIHLRSKDGKPAGRAYYHKAQVMALAEKGVEGCSNK